MDRHLLRFRLVLSLGLLAAIWQAIYALGLVPAKFLPGLPDVALGFWSMLQSGELLYGNGMTLLRAVLGLTAASLLGIALALVSDASPTFDKGFRPIADLIQPIPPAALVPVAVFTLGLGIKLYAFIILMVTVWPSYLNGRAALRAVAAEQLRTGRMLGMNRAAILWQIKLPAALPEIFAGIRYAATISLIAAVVAEMLSGRNGIGYLLVRKTFAIRTPEVYALMFVTALDGALLNLGVTLARRIFAGWQLRQAGLAA